MNSFLSALDSVALVERSGVPRKALRSLLVGNGLGPGARVLVVGAACVDLAQCLDGLGLFVTGFESNMLSLIALRRSAPLADWRGGNPRETACLPDQAFDLVVAREHPAWSGSLLSADACHTTAELLATLRPSGTLAFVLARGVAPGDGRPHDPSCFAEQITRLGGAARLEDFSAGSSRGWLRGLSTAPAATISVAQWTLSGTAVFRAEWLDRARSASTDADCCAAAESRSRHAA